MRRLAVLAAALVGATTLTPAVAFAVAAPSVGSSGPLAVVQGTTSPIADVVVTETAVGQLTVGDVLTVRFKDAAAASTVHLVTSPVVSGSNGLAATVAVGSSSASLADQAVITVTAASSGAYPGSITLAQLAPAFDVTAATGSATATVTDTVTGLNATTPVATVITGGTLKATMSATTVPTISSTGASQSAGGFTIAEPAKGFFKAGDVITVSVRDAYGSADTVGLAATPLASGGAMTLSVSGLNSGTVQPNEGGFKIIVNAGDPSNGSTSTITVSNLVYNTAQAPAGPITLTAAVTTGSATEYIAPGRVADATVGGNTTTTANGLPTLLVSTSAQLASNVSIAVQPGALKPGDTFTLAIQEPGVTFTTATPPSSSVTNGNLVLSSTTPVVDGTATTATWTVQSANSAPATVVLAPITLDVAATATVGNLVAVKTSGNASSAFTSQTVNIGKIVAGPAGYFRAVSAPVGGSSGAPLSTLPAGNVVFTEASAGQVPVGGALVLLSPYATQIAAYRTTFAAVPTAAVTAGTGLVLGTPTVNAATISVTTADGVVSAPAQTALIVPVTAASSAAATVTFSNISYKLGNYVAPGALIGTGSANSGSTSGGGTPQAGSQYVNAINGNNLGATGVDVTAPDTFIDSGPSGSVYNLSAVTFVFHSSEDPYATFRCTLVTPTATVSEVCSSPKSYASLANGSYTFQVAATDASLNSDPTPASSTFSLVVDRVAPTAVITAPVSLASPVTVTFSEPVSGLSTSNVLLFSNPTPSTSTPVAATLTCFSGTASSSCAAGPVTKALLKPTTPLTAGQRYTASVNGVGSVGTIHDGANNAVAATTKAFRASLTEQETSVGAKPLWRTVTASGPSGGSYTVAHQAGAAASLRTAGGTVTWYTVTGPDQGYAYVYVGSTLRATVNNYATSRHYGVARTYTGVAAGTFKVVVRGVKGSTAGTDSQVSVDRIVVGSTTTESSSASIAYSWRRIVASSASGGGYAVSDVAGSSYSFTFRGTGVSWYTVLSPAMGKANVYIDGVLKGTFDQYAASAGYNAVRRFGALTDSVHTVKIVVLGTHRSTSVGNGVAVDRFVVV